MLRQESRAVIPSREFVIPSESRGILWNYRKVYATGPLDFARDDVLTRLLRCHDMHGHLVKPSDAGGKLAMFVKFLNLAFAIGPTND
jgi:hypothetical protein